MNNTRTSDISMYLLLILHELEHEYGDADVQEVGICLREIDAAIKGKRRISRIAALIAALRYEVGCLRHTSSPSQ